MNHLKSNNFFLSKDEFETPKIQELNIFYSFYILLFFCNIQMDNLKHQKYKNKQLGNNLR